MPIDMNLSDKTRFARVPVEVSKDQRLKLSDYRVLTYLLSRKNPWHVHATQVSCELGMHEKTVRDSLKHLQALGYADPIMKQVGKQMQAVDWIIRAVPLERPAAEHDGQAQNPGSTIPTPRASEPGTPRVPRPAIPGSTDPGHPGPGDPPTKNEGTQSEVTEIEPTQSEPTQTRASQLAVAASPLRKASAPEGGWRTTDEEFSAWVEWQVDEYEANAEEQGGHFDRQAMVEEYWMNRALYEMMNEISASSSTVTGDEH